MTPKEYQANILAKYSSPGLRRNILTREAKREQLRGKWKKSPEEAEEILLKLYGPEKKS